MPTEMKEAMKLTCMSTDWSSLWTQDHI